MMLINRGVFYNELRQSIGGGRLAQSFVDGAEVILERWEGLGFEATVNDNRLAYTLATAWHETAHTMLPVRETLASSDRQAIARLDRAWAKGQLRWVSSPYWRTGWFGRGYVQLTHRDNYQRLGDRIGIDLVADPSLAMKPDIAADIMIIGMEEGLFTSHSTSTFIDEIDESDDEDLREYIRARRVVNGTDRARLIAGHALAFERAIEAGREAYTEPMESHQIETTGSQGVNSTIVQGGGGAGAVGGLVVANEIAQQVQEATETGASIWQALGEAAPYIAALFIIGLGVWWVVRGRKRHAYFNGV